MLDLAINGAAGRMGKEIRQIISEEQSRYNLSFSRDRGDALPLTTTAAVLIDFSSPASTMEILPWLLEQNIPLVSGTTGFSPEELAQLKSAATQLPILISANMSLSVNVLFKVAELVAKTLANFEVEIIESHHRYKKDAPSGTALRLGQAVAEARGHDFSQVAVLARQGNDNPLRASHEIGFAVVRGGDIVGKHQLAFISDGEELSLTSEVRSRRSFATGALQAAKFLAQAKAGWYSMEDVLGLKQL